MKRNINITGKEFEAYCKWNKYLSDMDYSLNRETGEYDVPAIEWEDYYGRWWSRYESEEAREAALDKYEKELEEWVLAHRAEKVKNRIRKEREAREIAKMKTLGGMFPELAKLK